MNPVEDAYSLRRRGLDRKLSPVTGLDCMEYGKEAESIVQLVADYGQCLDGFVVH